MPSVGSIIVVSWSLYSRSMARGPHMVHKVCLCDHQILSHCAVNLCGFGHSQINVDRLYLLNKTTVRFFGHFVTFFVYIIIQLYIDVLFFCVKITYYLIN